ncbi:PRC-barrel domain-containing protein [Yeosuana sp. AK3]
MLINAKTLKGYKLNGIDGEVGKVNEFYFDDKYWTIRYLIAETGGWLTGRQVLISPYALTEVNEKLKHINIDLTKKQIENSPSLESDKPVSRQFEVGYYGYYGYPTYWGGSYMWGYYPNIMRDSKEWKKAAQEEEKTWDSHLRSTNTVSGYHLQANDGEIGHVKDFVIDEDTWAIRYLIIDTKNWWPGKIVLVSPQWVERVSWDESKVFVNLSREIIKKSPEYNDESLLSREYEIQLHQHYNRKGYWLDEPIVKRQTQ